MCGEGRWGPLGIWVIVEKRLIILFGGCVGCGVMHRDEQER